MLLQTLLLPMRVLRDVPRPRLHSPPTFPHAASNLAAAHASTPRCSKTPLTLPSHFSPCCFKPCCCPCEYSEMFQDPAYTPLPLFPMLLQTLLLPMRVLRDVPRPRLHS